MNVETLSNGMLSIVNRKMKRYRVNVGRLDAIYEINRGIYKSRGLHKAFNKGGIQLLVKSSKSPQIKNRVCVK